MPTYERLPEALAGYRRLGPGEREVFREALGTFMNDLLRWEQVGMIGRPRFSAELRVKDIQMRKGVWKMTWRWPDGRATFQYGLPMKEGRAHVI